MPGPIVSALCCVHGDTTAIPWPPGTGLGEHPPPPGHHSWFLLTHGREWRAWDESICPLPHPTTLILEAQQCLAPYPHDGCGEQGLRMAINGQHHQQQPTPRSSTQHPTHPCASPSYTPFCSPPPPCSTFHTLTFGLLIPSIE